MTIALQVPGEGRRAHEGKGDAPMYQ
jgi:hypothetical protein